MRAIRLICVALFSILLGCSPKVRLPVEDMIEIREGEFVMGDSLCGEEALPVHHVYLSTFFIDRHEVTNGDFVTFLNANKRNADEIAAGELGCRIFRDGRKYSVEEGYEDYPVTTVTWNGARLYAKWRNARLPTEAEWEKAARGTAGMAYPWGNTFLENRANCMADSLRAVGSFPAGSSPYGVMDMAGNAWEWVNDAWGRDYYSKSPSHNPKGPDFDGRYRVLRGGNFRTDSLTVRCAFRGHHFENKKVLGVGFRCARDGF